MSSPSPSPTLLDKLLFVLAPIRAAAESDTYLRNATRGLGWDLEAAGVDVPGAVKNLRELASDIDTLMRFGGEPPAQLDDYLKLLATSGRVFDRLRDLGTIFDSAGSVSLEELGRDFLNGMVLAAWYRFAPISFGVANVLTLIEEGPEAAEISAAGRVIRHKRPTARIRLDRLGPLLRDPVGLLSEEYFSLDHLTDRETAFRAADRLFPRLAFLVTQLGLGARYGLPPNERIEGDVSTREELDHTLTIFGVPSEGVAFGASFALSSAVNARGLVVRPFGQLSFQRNLDPWHISLEASETIDGVLFGENIELRGGGALRLRGRAELVDSEDRATTLGGTSGSGLQLGAARVEGELTIDSDKTDVALSISFDHVRLGLAAGDGDGFLSSVLPTGGMNADVPLTIGWTNRQGFHLSSSATLSSTLPLHRNVGPVCLETLGLAIVAGDNGVQAQATLAITLALGPVMIAIAGVGLAANIGFPENSGNLGVADLDLSFKPPSGVGLAIQSTSVSGGGFLFLDQEKGQYAGVVQLTIQDRVTVTAIGVITTRLPNGAKGFSFVILITAEGFRPIPLGLGFTLTGIGGLLAINRTCNEEFLREGIKNNTLRDLLFPQDPIRNAPQIFGTLNNAFPPQPGSYLFGPVLQICWSTPALLTMDLGVVLELGNRTRLIILGRVAAILPSEKHDLLRLQMNALGVIDFDQNSISLDAVLYDSRLVGKFPLTGSMALRLNWGSAPIFALSIGGFHPAFKPPANFPALRRLALSLANSDDFRLRLECYLAITSNTLQFGAKLELFARAGGFSIEGRLGFDVLIQFDPFAFLADFYASVQLKFHSSNLFKVKVEGQLAGPRPLHVKGKATFEIFWCDFSVRFDKTLISGAPPPQLEPVNVMEQLLAALNDAQNWSGPLADGERRLVTLREAAAAGQIALHPLGKLSVKQKVVPLDLEIAKFGNTMPADARRFSITSLSVNGKEAAFTRLKDFFAPSQFLELSDDEKLAAPSFEPMTAGLSVGAESFLFTTNDADILLEEAIQYETIIVDREFEATNNGPREAPPMMTLSADFLTRHLSLGAAARSAVRNRGSAKYRPPAAKNSLVRKGWTITSAQDGSPQAAFGHEAGQIGSYAESFQALQKVKQEDPSKAKTLMLIRTSVN